MRSGKLIGKTALVTGAARRIGRNIALALADSGVNVVIHYRSSVNEAEMLQAEVVQRGVKAWLTRGDFERSGDSSEVIRSSFEAAGSIDFLVNNAASFNPATVQNANFADLMRDIRVNAWSPFDLSREFARQFGRGKIINLLDTRIADFDRAHIGYTLSKKMLLAVTEILAVEFAPLITVNAVAPGLILPPEGKDQKYLESLAPLVPLERHGDPGDVGDAVLFLLANDFITGQIVYVDGGYHLKERSTHGSNYHQ